MRGRHVALFALIAGVTAALVWGLSTRGSSPQTAAPSQPPVSAPAATPAATTDPAPTAPACKAGATTAATGDQLLAVKVIRPTVATQSPSGKKLGDFGLRNVNGVRTVFSVRATRVGADCKPRWYKVQLPIRPNGITGWVKARDVKMFKVGAQVTVDLSDRRVRVLRGGKLVLDVPAAIGTRATPTPIGSFYVNQRLWAKDPNGPWGPGGVGISAFSPVLVDWAQGGPIAIHGTNQPYLLGDAISHGCVRVSNYALLQLMKLAPEGTPVVIRA